MNETVKKIEHLIELKDKELERAKRTAKKLAAEGNPNWQAVDWWADMVGAEIRGLRAALRVAKSVDGTAV